MRRGLIAICVATIGVWVAGPGTSTAAVNCTLVVTATLTVDITAGSTQASLVRDGSDIRVYDGPIAGGSQICAGGAPTVTNTDQIVVTDLTGGNTALLVSLQGGQFAPGENIDPPPGSADATGPEIEILYHGDAGTDRIELDGTASADDFDLAEGAVTTFNANVNPAADGASPDCDDIAATGTERAIVRGRGGDDNINATSCVGPEPDPLTADLLRLEGNNGADFLRGGPGRDELRGGTQDDNLNGGVGDDFLDGERDDDRFDGGVGADFFVGDTGTDRVRYSDRTQPLTVTIGNDAPDDGDGLDQGGSGRDNVTSSVENLTGGSGPDSIVGSSVRNVIDAGLGDDFVDGLGGNDDVDGEGGNDTVDGGDGNDAVRGGDGDDVGRGSGGSDDLFGGAGADRLLGGPKADFLKGDKGKDAMAGKAGIDRINARDRKRDRKINCGKGKDKRERAKVDKADPKPKSC